MQASLTGQRNLQIHFVYYFNESSDCPASSVMEDVAYNRRRTDAKSAPTQNEEVIGVWRELRDEVLHNFQMIKSRRRR